MVWIVPLLVAVLSQAAKDPTEDQILDFKKYYKPSRSVHERVEAIHVLDKLDRVSAAELLLDATQDPQFPVRQAALEVLGGYRSSEPSASASLAARSSVSKRVRRSSRSPFFFEVGLRSEK